jgi:protein dithiol oxidoreductase (disulfide-forming)
VQGALVAPVASLGLPSTALGQAPSFVLGEHYTKLKTQAVTSDAKKIEITEFFLFTCPYCYRLEAPLNAWLAKQKPDVMFRKEHMIGPGFGGKHQQFYYALVAMGIQAKVIPVMFDRIHKENQRPSDLSALAQIAATAGVSEAQFLETYKSFAVRTRMNQSDQRAQTMRVEGVPTVVVNGRYVTTPKKAGGDDKIFSLLDQLVAQERQSLAS